MHTNEAEDMDHPRSTYDVMEEPTSPEEYEKAEESFAEFVKAKCLDDYVRDLPPAVRLFESAVEKALSSIYPTDAEDARRHTNQADDCARLFLQRVLYRINRLKLFWFDDLNNYDNERSAYLHQLRDRVEQAWQASELSFLNVAALRRENVREALLRRAAYDVSPPPSTTGLYFRDHVGHVGYRRLLAIASLDGLVEASQLSRTLGGVSNDIHSMLTRVLVEEYGGGKLNRKHSSFFTAMLNELEMRTEPEAYFDLVPWEVLAGISHSFLLSERKRFYLRYVGGLLYTEISVPAAFDNYRAAAERLVLPKAARGYWELHIREDKRHGQWMLYDVALPLAARYPAEAWEITLGYDQQKLISERSGASVARSVRAAEVEAAHQRTLRQSAA
jgi:hypothetical protein